MRPIHVLPFALFLLGSTPIDARESCLPADLPCECTATLSVSSEAWGCFRISVSVGLPESEPKCNSHAGCNESVQCNADPGTATCSVAWTGCIACNGPVEIFLGTASQGTISVGSTSTINVPVGGDLIPCTGSGETEGDGDEIKMTCPGLPFPATHVFVVKDGCTTCAAPIN